MLSSLLGVSCCEHMSRTRLGTGEVGDTSPGPSVTHVRRCRIGRAHTFSLPVGHAGGLSSPFLTRPSEVLAILLLLMCAYEPMYHCLATSPQDWPTYNCDDIEARRCKELCQQSSTARRVNCQGVRFTHSALGLVAMAVHWFLMVDLAVFSTGLSAFVLVCAQARTGNTPEAAMLKLVCAGYSPRQICRAVLR